MATRKVVKVRAERRSGDALYVCEVVRDGLRLVVSIERTDTRTNETSRIGRFGERAATPADAAQRFEQLIQTHAAYGDAPLRTEENHPDDGEPASPFGDLDVKLDSELYDLAWEDGVLRGASLKRSFAGSTTDLARLTRDLLALPVAQHVTRLRFGLERHDGENDWTDTLAAVASSAQAPQIRSLRFDDYTEDDCELSWTPFGDFGASLPALPALEELSIRSGAGGELGDLALPNLRKFVRVSGGLRAPEIRSIIAATWPKLEHLEVWFGSRVYGAEGTAADVASLLEGGVPASLVHLGIVNCELTPALIEPLARSPVLRQLRTLDLSKGVLIDRDAEVLLRHADAFRHLARLDLSENLFLDAGAAIREALPNANVDDQRDGYDDDDDPDAPRYVAVGE